jgi:hypothetical protein
VQSTALFLLAAENPARSRLDAAIFADTGWEPAGVYAHLDRLEAQVARPAGIPIYRVSAGNLRADALDPARRFASMPLYVRNPGGAEAMGRRQCTNQYKLVPILRKVRELLGAPMRPDGIPGRVRGGAWAQQWIGISADEAGRALSIKSLRYARSRFPLLEPTIWEGLTRADCADINAANGFPDVPKSACLGCPYHRNPQWRDLRDNRPGEWADVVAFDAAIRDGYARATANGKQLRGQMFLHRSLLPLDQAPIDHVTRAEWATRQGNLLDIIPTDHSDGDEADDEGEPRGCSPFGCRLDPADLDGDDLDQADGDGTQAGGVGEAGVARAAASVGVDAGGAR